MFHESRTLEQPQHSAKRSFQYICWGLLHYYLSGLVVVLGMMVGHDYLKSPRQRQGDLLDAFANWDGKWYREIVEFGYSYDPEATSNVAFFPAFPLLARWLAHLTGLPSNEAMLLVAHVCLAGAFVTMAAYLHERLGESYPSVGGWALASMGLFPTTFFFRMTYSESLFLWTMLLAFYGMERQWPLPVIAMIVGLATATRPVGVALLGPFLLHVVGRAKTRRGGLLTFGALTPLACWGIIAFMIFQWWAFDEPLAFAKTQPHWRVRPPVALSQHVMSLVTLEPIWSLFDPASPCYWRNQQPDGNPLLSMECANPAYFSLTLALIVLGGYKRWLNSKELCVAAGLLLIPYVTRSHEMCMGSMGRFAAVVFPVYLVLGQVLARMRAPAAALLLALCGFFLGTYAALFASWHRVF